MNTVSIFVKITTNLFQEMNSSTKTPTEYYGFRISLHSLRTTLGNPQLPLIRWHRPEKI